MRTKVEWGLVTVITLVQTTLGDRFENRNMSEWMGIESEMRWGKFNTSLVPPTLLVVYCALNG